jgi:hypothetical protein
LSKLKKAPSGPNSISFTIKYLKFRLWKIHPKSAVSLSKSTNNKNLNKSLIPATFLSLHKKPK